MMTSYSTNRSLAFLPQARTYFKALPANKTPVRGTPGERYRQKQLIRQLPAHDVDIFYCNDLSDEEKKQMEVFLKMRREKVLGKGEVKLKEEGDSSREWVCVSHSVSVFLSANVSVSDCI